MDLAFAEDSVLSLGDSQPTLTLVPGDLTPSSGAHQ